PPTGSTSSASTSLARRITCPAAAAAPGAAPAPAAPAGACAPGTSVRLASGSAAVDGGMLASAGGAAGPPAAPAGAPACCDGPPNSDGLPSCLCHASHRNSSDIE